MASVGETLEIEDAVNYGLNILGKGDLVLKDKQLEIIRYITLEKRDVMAVLPTGYGKSLVYQLIPPIVDFMEFGKTPSAAGAIVLVFSPLNALIRDQVIKLRENPSVRRKTLGTRLVRAQMTQKSCAVGMRNAIQRNYLKGVYS